MAFALTFKEEAPAASGKPLAPYKVHKVELKAVELGEIERKDGSGKLPKLDITFGNTEGDAKVTIFIPNDKEDTKRGKSAQGFEQASRAEEFMAAISQLMSVANPEGYKKLIGIPIKSAAQAAAATEKVLSSAIGNEVWLKLNGKYNNQGYINYSIPYLCGIRKQKGPDGVAPTFVKNNFVGAVIADKPDSPTVYLSSYEEQKGREFAATPRPGQNKPTEMEDLDVPKDLASGNKGSEDDPLAGLF